VQTYNQRQTTPRSRCKVWGIIQELERRYPLLFPPASVIHRHSCSPNSWLMNALRITHNDPTAQPLESSSHAAKRDKQPYRKADSEHDDEILPTHTRHGFSLVDDISTRQASSQRTDG
jgi:hypothetical protein